MIRLFQDFEIVLVGSNESANTSIRVIETQVDPKEGTADYRVEYSGGKEIAIVEQWPHGKDIWGLLQVALNLENPDLKSGEVVRRHEGECFARTLRGHFCKIPANPGTKYCGNHTKKGKVYGLGNRS